MSRGVSTNTVSVTCQECGGEFTAQRRSAKFCGDVCKLRAWRKMDEQRTREAEQRRRQQAAIDLAENHRQKWTTWLRSNPKVTIKAAGEMYTDGMKRGLIPRPFPNEKLF